MTPQTNVLDVNPADETIRFASLAVRFLITGDQSNGSMAATLTNREGAFVFFGTCTPP